MEQLPPKIRSERLKKAAHCLGAVALSIASSFDFLNLSSLCRLDCSINDYHEESSGDLESNTRDLSDEVFGMEQATYQLFDSLNKNISAQDRLDLSALHQSSFLPEQLFYKVDKQQEGN